MNTKRSVALLNPFPSPYRIPILNALAQIPDIDLTVYITDMKGVPDHRWDTDVSSWHFRYKVLPSVVFRYYTPRYGAAYFPVNFTLPYEILRRRHDVIVAFGWTMLYSNLALLLGKLLGVKTILWEESIPHPPSKLKQILDLVIKRIIGSYDAWLAASSGCKEYLASYGANPERIYIVPQVVDFDFFTGHARSLALKQSQLRDRWDVRGKRVICFIGQLIQRKGIIDLVEAVAKIQKAIPEATLLIAGIGPLEREIKARIRNYGLDENDVRLLGYLPQSKLPELYAVSDVFVLPSYYDAFGAVVLEAMASGLPVVVTEAVGATYDLIIDGDNGFIVPVGDVTGLSEAIIKVLGDKVIRSRMSLASKIVLEHWSIPRGVNAFTAAVTEVCKS